MGTQGCSKSRLTPAFQALVCQGCADEFVLWRMLHSGNKTMFSVEAALGRTTCTSVANSRDKVLPGHPAGATAQDCSRTDSTAHGLWSPSSLSTSTQQETQGWSWEQIHGSTPSSGGWHNSLQKTSVYSGSIPTRTHLALVDEVTIVIYRQNTVFNPCVYKWVLFVAFFDFFRFLCVIVSSYISQFMQSSKALQYLLQRCG